MEAIWTFADWNREALAVSLGVDVSALPSGEGDCLDVVTSFP